MFPFRLWPVLSSPYPMAKDKPSDFPIYREQTRYCSAIEAIEFYVLNNYGNTPIAHSPLSRPDIIYWFSVLATTHTVIVDKKSGYYNIYKGRWEVKDFHG